MMGLLIADYFFEKQSIVVKNNLSFIYKKDLERQVVYFIGFMNPIK